MPLLKALGSVLGGIVVMLMVILVFLGGMGVVFGIIAGTAYNIFTWVIG